MPLPEGFKPVSAYLPPDILSPLTAYCLEHSLTRKDKQGNLIPSLGSGIVEVLREFFKGNVSSPVPSALPSNLLSEDELMGKIEKIIKRDYEESRLPLIEARIDEWGRQLEQGMRESLRNELDSLRNELEGKMRDDQPIPEPPTPVDDSLPLFPDWEPPNPPDETQPNSALEETVTIIDINIPTEPNSSDEEINPMTSDLATLKKGLTGAQLTHRLGYKNDGSLRGFKNDEDLAEMTKKRDPDNLAWRRAKNDGKTRKVGQKGYIYYPIIPDYLLNSLE